MSKNSEIFEILVPDDGVAAVLEPLLARYDAKAGFTVDAQSSSFTIKYQGLSASLATPSRAGAIIDAVMRLKRSASMQNLEAISFGEFSFDPETLSLIAEKRTPVRLTEKETALLYLLHDQNGNAVTRDEILKEVWGYAEGLDTHTLETHIYRLRQKIEDDPGTPQILITSDDGYILKC